MLNKEFNWYLSHQSELVEKYNGRVLVIVGEQVVGDFNNIDDAYWSSVKKHELGTFLLMKCTEGEDAYTQTFYTPIFR